jgi:hypothetical protein
MPGMPEAVATMSPVGAERVAPVLDDPVRRVVQPEAAKAFAYPRFAASLDMMTRMYVLTGSVEERLVRVGSSVR